MQQIKFLFYSLSSLISSVLLGRDCDDSFAQSRCFRPYFSVFRVNAEATAEQKRREGSTLIYYQLFRLQRNLAFRILKLSPMM